MKDVFKSLIAALFVAGIGMPVYAADPAPAGTPAPGGGPGEKAAPTMDHKAAKEKAEADYKAALADCKKQQGDAAKTCMKDAKAARDKALSEHKAPKGGAKAPMPMGGGEQPK